MHGELLSRARDGDTEAFCEIASAHEERLFRQALALCRDPSTAEDLAAETLIAAWNGIGRFDGACRISTWLYAILLHRYQKLVRACRPRPIPLASLGAAEAQRGESLLERVPDAQPAAPDRLANQELSGQLLAALSQIPEKHQQVLLMRFYEGASLPEIAAALGLPVGTIKSRLHHGLEKLRQNKGLLNLLTEEGDTRL